MFESAFSKAIVTGQRIRVATDVGDALHIAVTAEDVGPAAAHANVAQGQLQQTRRTHHGVADGVLGMTHTPHKRAWTVLSHGLGYVKAGGFIDATGFQHLVWRPFGQHVIAYFVHAPNAVIDIFFVFPSILEDVPHHTKKEWNV